MEIYNYERFTDIIANVEYREAIEKRHALLSLREQCEQLEEKLVRSGLLEDWDSLKDLCASAGRRLCVLAGSKKERKAKTMENTIKIKIKANDFMSDFEKLLDMKELRKGEFLASYSYTTEEEYDNTMRKIEKMGGLRSYQFSKHIYELVERECQIPLSFTLSYITGKEMLKEGFWNNVFEASEYIKRTDLSHFIIFLVKERNFDVVGSGLSYGRLKEIAKSAVDEVTDAKFTFVGVAEGLESLRSDVGLDDEEIDAFGYGWALENEKEGGEE